MAGEPAPRVVVVGGHSAGHIEPAMNLADALLRLDPAVEITALGSPRGLDTTLVPTRGHTLELVPPVPLPRRPNRMLLQMPTRLVDAVRVAAAVLDRVGAEVVVGFGGYVAMPAYLAARRRRLPIVVHEANARPGIANRVGARMTRHVFTAAPGVTLAHAAAVGIPLRPAIAGLDRAALRPAARRRFGLRPHGPVLLVTGGSQGARSISSAVAGAAGALRSAGVGVLHITGPGRVVAVPDGHVDDPPHVVVPYVDRMQDAYAAADLALCRCGAMTCAELTAVGLPAAYVPLPARGGEQRHNAEPLVDAGGALLVDDSDLTPAWIEGVLIPVLTDPERLAVMSVRASAACPSDAGAVLARHVLAVVAERRLARPAARGARGRR